jgi:hypothetical protein
MPESERKVEIQAGAAARPDWPPAGSSGIWRWSSNEAANPAYHRPRVPLKWLKDGERASEGVSDNADFLAVGTSPGGAE